MAVIDEERNQRLSTQIAIPLCGCIYKVSDLLDSLRDDAAKCHACTAQVAFTNKQANYFHFPPFITTEAIRPVCLKFSSPDGSK